MNLAVPEDAVVAALSILSDNHRKTITLMNQAAAPVENRRCDRPLEGCPGIAGIFRRWGVAQCWIQLRSVIHIQTNEVQRLADPCQILRADFFCAGSPGGDGVIGITPLTDWIQEPVVVEPEIVRLSRVLRRMETEVRQLGRGDGGMITEVSHHTGRRNADLCLRNVAADSLRGQTVGQKNMMPAIEHIFRRKLQPRRMQAKAMAQTNDDLGLIDGNEMADLSLKTPDDKFGILLEGKSGFPILPAAFFLQSLGKVPVIEGEPGRDSAGQTPVDQALIVVQTLFVYCAGSLRQDPGPADTEAVSRNGQLLHKVQILLEPVIAIACHIATPAAGDAVRLMREDVPDGCSLPVFGGAALGLIRRAGRAPDEIRRKEAEVIIVFCLTI